MDNTFDLIGSRSSFIFGTQLVPFFAPPALLIRPGDGEGEALTAYLVLVHRMPCAAAALRAPSMMMENECGVLYLCG
ncbi:MAG: hypothetical protein V4857_09055 [Pseudomonadota bacterium]